MRDVAREAGVSAMTVSRVVRDDARVAAPTRERVLEAIARLGYVPNRSAHTLRTGASDTLGLVVPDLANPFYADLATGVEAEASRRGRRLLVASSGRDPERERDVVADLHARRIAGLVLVTAAPGLPTPAGLPTVYATRPAGSSPAAEVLLDDEGGAAALARRLVDAGHTRIGFVGPAPTWTIAQRLAGFRRALGAAADDALVRLGARGVAASSEAVGSLMAADDPPTALFCANSRSTLGAVRATARLDSPPRLAGFDDFEAADLLGVALDLATYDVAELGRAAVDRLGDPAPGRTLLPVTLVSVPAPMTGGRVRPRS
ncbi:LacI family DNA-binding transcriptional regulator [Mariniluteicoccus flavus]